MSRGAFNPWRARRFSDNSTGRGGAPPGAVGVVERAVRQ